MWFLLLFWKILKCSNSNYHITRTTIHYVIRRALLYYFDIMGNISTAERLRKQVVPLRSNCGVMCFNVFDCIDSCCQLHVVYPIIVHRHTEIVQRTNIESYFSIHLICQHILTHLKSLVWALPSSQDKRGRPNGMCCGLHDLHVVFIKFMVLSLFVDYWF